MKNSAALRNKKVRLKIKTTMPKYYHSSPRWLSLADAKSRLNIHHLWRHFGFDGEPKTSCHSPFRDDIHPSFSVNAEGTLWHDFATGDGGDSIDFFQHATGLSKKNACLKFIELAGGRIVPSLKLERSQFRPHSAESRRKPVFPIFRKGTVSELGQLADLRHISREGLELASERNLLWFATLKGCLSWIVTDSARVNAQARRIDGLPWNHITSKAWTLPGSWASWPIGIAEAQSSSAIALCEGAPDLLTAFHFAFHEFLKAQCSPVAMLGATQQIHPEALHLFRGKYVRIFGHDDGAGRSAIERWSRQLSSVTADLDAYNFAGLVRRDGAPVKDLNDLLLMDNGAFDQIGTVLPK